MTTPLRSGQRSRPGTRALRRRLSARGRQHPPCRLELAAARRRTSRGADAASARGRAEPRRTAGRPNARSRRGGRQEPPPSLRRRSHPAQPPAHERPLARSTPRRASAWHTLARPANSRLRGLQWNGPILTLRDDRLRALGPDILERPPDLDAMVARLRGAPDLHLAEALQRQQLVAGIGNMWVAEVLWASRLSPWLFVRDLSDDQLTTVLRAAHEQMATALEGRRTNRMSTAVLAVAAGAAGRRFARSRRATGTALPTGARVASRPRRRSTSTSPRGPRRSE